MSNYVNFSDKQLKAMNWWLSDTRGKSNGIVADGAVRSGKTLSLSLSFILWSCNKFANQNFAICGRTIQSCMRNVVTPLLSVLEPEGYKVKINGSQNWLEVTTGEVTNRYYIFGGENESSQYLIQGITLAGILFDEVALMTESFVNQALARCSVSGAKFWFNCNPDNPNHWFYTKFIEKKDEVRLEYLHFTMDDNPSLTEDVKERYRLMYSASPSFYSRYIEGLWTASIGAVYSLFDKSVHVVETENRPYTEYQISIDYGTRNPFSMGLWGYYNGVWYRVKEYYYSAREKGKMKTDDEYYNDLEEFAKDLPIKKIIIDPSAASFIELIRRKGKYITRKAVNDVIEGIQSVALALQRGDIKINDCCKDSIREFSLYKWNEKANEDQVIKENDHAMDDIRYFVFTNKIARIQTKSIFS